MKVNIEPEEYELAYKFLLDFMIIFDENGWAAPSKIRDLRARQVLKELIELKSEKIQEKKI